MDKLAKRALRLAKKLEDISAVEGLNRMAEGEDVSSPNEFQIIVEEAAEILRELAKR